MIRERQQADPCEPKKAVQGRILSTAFRTGLRLPRDLLMYGARRDAAEEVRLTALETLAFKPTFRVAQAALTDKRQCWPRLCGDSHTRRRHSRLPATTSIETSVDGVSDPLSISVSKARSRIFSNISQPAPTFGASSPRFHLPTLDVGCLRGCQKIRSAKAIGEADC
jgi:hypothetical protein